MGPGGSAGGVYPHEGPRLPQRRPPRLELGRETARLPMLHTGCAGPWKGRGALCPSGHPRPLPSAQASSESHTQPNRGSLSLTASQRPELPQGPRASPQQDQGSGGLFRQAGSQTHARLVLQRPPQKLGAAYLLSAMHAPLLPSMHPAGPLSEPHSSCPPPSTPAPPAPIPPASVFQGVVSLGEGDVLTLPSATGGGTSSRGRNPMNAQFANSICGYIMQIQLSPFPGKV